MIDVSSKKLVWKNNEFTNFEGLFVMGFEGLSGNVKADQASGKINWRRGTEIIDLDFSKLELKQILSAEKSSSSNLSENDIDESVTVNFKVDNFTNKFGTLGNINISISFEPELKTWLIKNLTILSDDFQLFASGFWKIVEEVRSYPMLNDKRAGLNLNEPLKLTETNFRLETDNIQALMDKVGYTGLFGQAEDSVRAVIMDRKSAQLQLRGCLWKSLR